MHVGLGKVLAVEDQRPIPAPLTESVQLKHFAREAEVNENFELAAKFYQEVSVRLLSKHFILLSTKILLNSYLCFDSNYNTKFDNDSDDGNNVLKCEVEMVMIIVLV